LGSPQLAAGAGKPLLHLPVLHHRRTYFPHLHRFSALPSSTMVLVVAAVRMALLVPGHCPQAATIGLRHHLDRCMWFGETNLLEPPVWGLQVALVGMEHHWMDVTP